MYYLANIPEIRLAPDVLFQVGNVNITSSMMALLIVNIILILFALLVRSKAGIMPSKTQVAYETVHSFFYEKIITAFGSEKDARKFTPFIITIFLMFFVANQFSIIPLLSDLSYGSGELVKTPTADFSLPIAIAILTVFLANIMAFMISPLRHIGGFLKFHKIFQIRKLSDIPNAFLEIFLGLLDIIGELAKIISLSARLFGNVLAGELMVLIITFLAVFTTFIVPIPFIFLSIFSGVIQAFVFPLLALSYIGGSVRAVRENA